MLRPLFLVVSYRNSTSNHNWVGCIRTSLRLYLIEILHQTTTRFEIEIPNPRCILSKFYIKPQRSQPPYFLRLRCILSKFYIKPQPFRRFRWMPPCCILSKFYIKPQQSLTFLKIRRVVSYRNSTSNHNPGTDTFFTQRLYLIEILHQTTTMILLL